MIVDFVISYHMLVYQIVVLYKKCITLLTEIFYFIEINKLIRQFHIYTRENIKAVIRLNFYILRRSLVRGKDGFRILPQG